MCGICGFYQYKNEADRHVLKEMNDRIIHRGPDDEGYFIYKQVGLATRRLSIIDLQSGHQPLASDSERCWICYNGEVYNFMELRRDLEARGTTFKTKSDTEVIVNLYEKTGLEFVKALRGMFAFAIYDKKADRLILARDPIGIKPLYYYQNPDSGTLVFGSEIKSILSYPGVPRQIDPHGLDYFLTLEYIPAPYSMFEGIKKLPAGHLLVFDKGRISINQYWDVQSSSRPSEIGALKEEFLALLEESVNMRMIADVPLGAFLSGGIDSSAIVATMSRLSKKKVQTFSIGFEEKSYSELEYSALASKRFNTDHSTRTLAPDINELVLKLAYYFDEPLGDFSNFPTYLVSATAREKVTVALSGDGGDEIFGGYEHYIAQRMAALIDIRPLRPLHPGLARITHLFPPSKIKKGWINRFKRFSEGLESDAGLRHFRWMVFLNQAQKEDLYSPQLMDDEFLMDLTLREPFKQHFFESNRFSGINRDLYLDLKTYLVDNILVKVDRSSMATSLEARVPLLDHKLVEFAFSLPARLKLRGATTKWFFKQAMADILPERIINRQKEGFSIPIKNWLNVELKDLMMEYLSRDRINHSGYFNHQTINRMISEHTEGRMNHSHRLWSLILFQIWKEKYIDTDDFKTGPS